MPTQALRTVTDRFSLVDNIRKHTAHNGRNYLMSAVRATISSPEVQERIRLGEMYGYYSHTNRALYHKETGNLDLPEVCYVTIDGKPVMLKNIPSNRTLAISIDDDGVVEHTQEILDTEPGHIVNGMERSMAGGWSWATGGTDSAISRVTSFHGFDYVTTPNYISLNRKAAMMESVSDLHAWRLEELIKSGYSEQGARDILAHFSHMQSHELMVESAQRSVDLQNDLLIMQGRMMELEGIIQQNGVVLDEAERLRKRRAAMLETAVRSLPVFLNEAQKKALVRLDSDDDLEIVSSMFESIATGNLNSLPIGASIQRESAPTATSKIGEVPPILPNGFKSFL
ncbi:head processing protein [Serratia marcescens]